MDKMNSYKVLEQELLERLGVAGYDNIKMSARYPSNFVDITINGSMAPSTVAFILEKAVEFKEFFHNADMGVAMIEYGIVINNLAFSITKWNTADGKEQILHMCKKKKTLVRLTYAVYNSTEWGYMR